MLLSYPGEGKNQRKRPSLDDQPLSFAPKKYNGTARSMLRVTTMNMIVYTLTHPLAATQSTATYRKRNATRFLTTLIITMASVACFGRLSTTYVTAMLGA